MMFSDMTAVCMYAFYLKKHDNNISDPETFLNDDLSMCFILVSIL